MKISIKLSFKFSQRIFKLIICFFSYLVLVELLEVISAHVRDIFSLGLIIVGGVSDDADFLVGSGNVGQPDFEFRRHKAYPIF